MKKEEQKGHKEVNAKNDNSGNEGLPIQKKRKKMKMEMKNKGKKIG